MKRLAAILLLFAVCALTGAQANSDLLQQATAAYERGDYVRAATLYESIIAEGGTDPALYFNLGNAYFQTGDLGRALLNYRRAAVSIPRDPNLNTNLAKVRAARTDILGDETGPAESLSALTSSSLTLTELAWLVFWMWLAWFTILIVGLWRRNWLAVLRVPLLGLGGVLVIGLLLLGSRLYVDSNRPSAVVIDLGAPVMSGPGSGYLQHFQIHAAAEIRILDTRGSWVRFELPDGRQGWISSDSIERVN